MSNHRTRDIPDPTLSGSGTASETDTDYAPNQDAQPCDRTEALQGRAVKRRKTASEQEAQLLLPKALVKAIVKSRAATAISVSVDAVDAIVKAASVFVSYAAVCSHEAALHARSHGGRLKIGPEDVARTVGQILHSEKAVQC
eukprot:COSAG05_NODE_1254_length_5375_cov_10.078658_5_plen_142_part_00